MITRDDAPAAPRGGYEPLSGTVVPRFAGLATFMRLPYVDPQALPADLDIGLVGIPFDSATTNRPGTRHGPRQVREMSTLMRPVNFVTGIAPHDLCNCADLGDAPVNPVDVRDTLERIESFYAALRARRITPLSIGGDHLVTYPILRALSGGEPLGMIHVDAHSDVGDTYFNGARLTHGTPFRRAIEDGVLDPRRTVQIGLRGTAYSLDERDWALEQGIRIIDMEEVMDLGIDAAVVEARRVVGEGRTYLTYDIDSLDPTYAPGTGTPEVGGLTSREALRLVRGFRKLDLVGADVVEVSPPLDPTGGTALIGASIAFELLCLLAETHAARHGARRR